MENSSAIAKINDRLRKQMSLGQLNIELSDAVIASPHRPEILQAIRKYRDFDPVVDVSGDHSIGIVVVRNNAYVFRFNYADERYDYAQEIGKRILSVAHLSEFRSIRLGNIVQKVAEKTIALHRGSESESDIDGDI